MSSFDTRLDLPKIGVPTLFFAMLVQDIKVEPPYFWKSLVPKPWPSSACGKHAEDQLFGGSYSMSYIDLN